MEILHSHLKRIPINGIGIRMGWPTYAAWIAQRFRLSALSYFNNCVSGSATGHDVVSLL